MSKLLIHLKIKSVFLFGCCILIAVLLIAVPVSSLALCEINELQVTKMEQLPNYGLTKDPEDRQQLTDGCTNRYPLWVDRDSVGWAGQTPITLHLRIPPTQSSNTQISGQIGFHTAKGKSAGVQVPRRIDLYAFGPDKSYTHIGGKTITDAEFKDRENHWVRVPFESKSSDIMVVIHASGNFLMLDEIQWSNKAEQVFHSEKTRIGTKQEAQKDSISRLKKSFSKGNRVVNVDKLHFDVSRKGIVTWLENPWGSLNELPTAKQMLTADENVSVIGTKGERESSCIGFLNTKASRQILKISLKGKDAPDDAITIGKLGRVLAADGEQVFDPIVALDKEKFELSPGAREFLWVTFDLDQLKPGNYDYQLEISGTDEKIVTTINYQVQVLPSIERSSNHLRTVVWSYLNDIPVKNNPQLALKDLSAHGVNVFVIHPSNIPKPGNDQSWNPAASGKLQKAVKHYAGHGLILLFMGWPRWLGDIGDQPFSRQKEVITKWVRKLNRQMTVLGLRKDEWALYPIDEPHGERLNFLKNVVVWVKEVDTKIRIYANPISTSSGKTTIADLRQLDSHIDYWQPDLRFAKGIGQKFFSELKKPWWIYDNPKAPAKSAKPIEYRQIAWDAWKIGASGIGFWSYSDTDSSSAWDDFDGKRPDWSVVYEDDTGPVSSRRWEAFREGTEDHRLLKYVLGDKNGIGNRIQMLGAEKLRREMVTHMAEHELNIETLISFRSRLLNLLISQTND